MRVHSGPPYCERSLNFRPTGRWDGAPSSRTLANITWAERHRTPPLIWLGPRSSLFALHSEIIDATLPQSLAYATYSPLMSDCALVTLRRRMLQSTTHQITARQPGSGANVVTSASGRYFAAAQTGVHFQPSQSIPDKLNVQRPAAVHACRGYTAPSQRVHQESRDSSAIIVAGLTVRISLILLRSRRLPGPSRAPIRRRRQIPYTRVHFAFAHKKCRSLFSRTPDRLQAPSGKGPPVWSCAPSPIAAHFRSSSFNSSSSSALLYLTSVPVSSTI